MGRSHTSEPSASSSPASPNYSLSISGLRPSLSIRCSVASEGPQSNHRSGASSVSRSMQPPTTSWRCHGRPHRCPRGCLGFYGGMCSRRAPFVATVPFLPHLDPESRRRAVLVHVARRRPVRSFAFEANPPLRAPAQFSVLGIISSWRVRRCWGHICTRAAGARVRARAGYLSPWFCLRHLRWLSLSREASRRDAIPPGGFKPLVIAEWPSGRIPGEHAAVP